MSFAKKRCFVSFAKKRLVGFLSFGGLVALRAAGGAVDAVELSSRALFARQDVNTLAPLQIRKGVMFLCRSNPRTICISHAFPISFEQRVFRWAGSGSMDQFWVVCR